MDSIGSIIKAVTPPPAGTPDFDRSDDRFDAFLANLHDDLTELRDEATVRAKDRAHAAGEDQARGREVREDAQRLGDLEAEDRAAFARALGRKSADETGTDEPGAGGVAEPEPAAADQPKATIEGEPAAAPVDTDEADATAPAAATATGEVANTLQAPTLDTATLAPTATPPLQTFDAPAAADIASVVGDGETSGDTGDTIDATFVLAAASLETPVDDLIAASGAPSPAAALAPAAAVASEIAVPTEGAVRDATNVLATLLPAAVSGQPARPKLAAAPLPLALGDEIPALPLTASATALANTSAPGKGIAQLFERIAARLNTSSAAGQGTATALPASLGAEIATSLTGNGLPSAVAAAVREWLGSECGNGRSARSRTSMARSPISGLRPF